MLKREKMLVDVAADGEEALKLISEKHYDLVISDIKMPKVRWLATSGAGKGQRPARTYANDYCAWFYRVGS